MALPFRETFDQVPNPSHPAFIQPYSFLVKQRQAKGASANYVITLYVLNSSLGLLRASGTVNPGAYLVGMTESSTEDIPSS